jgi:glycosyltransferase involved in cell wall biosynthesis
VVKDVTIAVPGDPGTATGGFGYDRRMIGELVALGWNVRLLNLGDGFPEPTAQIRKSAAARLTVLPRRTPVVVDGLAFGAMPETARMLSRSHCLVALVHHPLALETGLAPDIAAAFHASEKASLACARHVVATSRMIMRILLEDFGVPVERLSVVEPGVDAAERIPRIRAATVHLLSVGAIVPRKGYDVLVAALARIRHLPWRLVIVCDCTRSAHTAEQLFTRIREAALADRVTMRGIVSEDELSSLYAQADLFVLPSRFEGYGMAFTEAIAHGVPVVGTTAGAIGQTVPREAGVLVAPDDAEALAGALQHLIEHSEERERLAAAAGLVVFPSWKQQGALLAQILERVA